MLSVQVAVYAGIGQPVIDVSSSDGWHSASASSHSVHSGQLCKPATLLPQLQLADLLAGSCQ